ncbi:MAG: type II 3-dehydroquinate dehydratase [Tannerellaceae bacterium]|jgi:3-dehydroquinate dehydratase-2|nr:type II 3-dehydroquinate dehydratase [Tannerellaceae bacterium]
MKTIRIINGPNLNLLGRREPTVYGNASFGEYLDTLRTRYPQCLIHYSQSNIEGELINMIHEAGFGNTYAGIILNAGAYTHTSIALYDAINAVETPVVEVHISNVHSREPFRHTSMISAACTGVILGFGTDSYRLAVEAILHADATETDI